MQSENFHVAQRNVTSIIPHDTREIQLRVIDWKRLYRRVKGIKTTLANRELFAGVSWGITASALLTLIPLYQATQTVDPWVRPTFWIVSAASFIVGLIAWINMKDTSSDIAEIKKEVLKDMEELHCLYFPEKTPDEQ